jgi:hypothetical protein
LTASNVARDLFLYWLRDVHGRGFQPSASPEGLTIVSEGVHTLVLDVRPLVPYDDPAWDGLKASLEELIADDLPARIALWVPAGADLPSDEPAISEFVSHVRQTAVKLGPHERSLVPLPATMYLRKNADTGGVISATGGLNPHWARFTERVRGSYDLDSTHVHRLPESDEHLDELIDEVVAASERLSAGEVTPIETIDAWAIQRLSGDSGVTIVGVPPSEVGDLGLVVRRNFRRVLLEGAPPLRVANADLRALVVFAPYARIDQEGATTAMRGYDPGSYSGIDFVCLASDGVIKPLIQPPPALLPWNRGAATSA